MKPAPTVVQALANVNAVRTDGDLNLVLSNILLALVRKEITATDAHAAVAVTDGICNVLNTSIRAMRLQLDMERTSGRKVELAQLGKLVFAGDER